MTLTYLDVTLKDVSSTKADPTVDTCTVEHADMKIAMARFGSIESTMRQKQSSQNSGPHVEPWPGPNSGTSGVLPYVISEVPYAVLIW